MEDNKALEMGMIVDVSYGFTNAGVGLGMEIRTLEGNTVLFMEAGSVTQLLIDIKLSNIMALRGRPCAVSIDEDKTVRFERLI